MSQNPGRWALLTDEFDSMENRVPEYAKETPLDAHTFEDAVVEAIAAYRARRRYNPGPYANNREFPQNPRLVFRLED